MSDVSNLKVTKDVHKMSSLNMDEYATTLALSFSDYSLFRHFFKKYNFKDAITFFKIALKADSKNLFGLATKNNEAVSIFTKNGIKDASIFQFVKAGGLKYFFKFGIKSTLKMINFSSYALSIKKKYISENDMYLYLLATRPESRHHGFTNNVLTPVLDYCDKENKKCYLETLDEENTNIYKHFGFDVVEISDLPNSNLKIYCMLRNPNNK